VTGRFQALVRGRNLQKIGSCPRQPWPRVPPRDHRKVEAPHRKL